MPVPSIAPEVLDGCHSHLVVCARRHPYGSTQSLHHDSHFVLANLLIWLKQYQLFRVVNMESSRLLHALAEEIATLPALHCTPIRAEIKISFKELPWVEVPGKVHKGNDSSPLL